MRLSDVRTRLKDERAADAEASRLRGPADARPQPLPRRGRRGTPRVAEDTPLRPVVEHLMVRPATLMEVERAAIEAALLAADGNVSEAARALQMGRSNLYRKMRIHRVVVRKRSRE